MANNTPVTVDENGVELTDEQLAEQEMMNPTRGGGVHELDKVYTNFGEVMHLNLGFVKYDPSSRRFVGCDRNDPDAQPEATIKIVPTREGALADERSMLASSADWKNVFMPSLSDLQITFGVLRNKFVKYQMRATGEIFLDKKAFPSASADELKLWNKEAQGLWKTATRMAGAQPKLSEIMAKWEDLVLAKRPDWIGTVKIKKAPAILGVYQDRAESDAAAELFFASRKSATSSNGNGHAATPQAAPPAATKPAAGNPQMRAFALQALNFKWQAVGGKAGVYDPAVYIQFKQLYDGDATTNQYVKLDDPEVIAITGDPLA